MYPVGEGTSHWGRAHPAGGGYSTLGEGTVHWASCHLARFSETQIQAGHGTQSTHGCHMTSGITCHHRWQTGFVSLPLLPGPGPATGECLHWVLILAGFWDFFYCSLSKMQVSENWETVVTIHKVDYRKKKPNF